MMSDENDVIPPRKIAQSIAEFYRELVDGGIPDYTAVEITLMWIRNWLENE
jgi:hypothetical protein